MDDQPVAPASLGDRLKHLLNDGHLSQVVRGAAMVMGIRIAGAAIALISQVLLARWMGAFEYGIFAYVWVWVIILGILAPMGFGTSTLRFIPDYRLNRKWPRLAGILDASWRYVMLFGILFMLTGLAILWAFNGQIEAYYVAPLALALICVPGFALTDSLEGTARAFGWVNLAYFPAYIIRPLGIVLLGGAVFLSTGSLTGLQAVACALAATFLALAGQRILFKRRIGKTVPNAKPVHHVGYWIRTSMPFLMVEGLYLLLINTDIILLGHFVEPDQVGIYFAATRIANLITFIYFAVAALAVPKFSELHAANDRDGLQKFVHDIIQWIFWPTLLGTIFILAVGGFALDLFGDGFHQGTPVLWVLVLGFLARASTGPIEYLLDMTGNQNATATVYAFVAVLNIALNFILVPHFGLMGAAASTAASLIFASFALFMVVRMRLGINAFVFMSGRPMPFSALLGRTS